MEKNYELCVLFSGTQTPAEIDERAKQIEALIATMPADIKSVYSLGRKKLAYLIKGNTHGEYRCWLFSALAETIPALNEKLRLSPLIIRHLLTTLENNLLARRLQKAQEIKSGKVKEVTAEPEFRIEKTEKASEPKPEEKQPVKEKAKLSLGDLDKKLDEILGSDKI